MQIHNTNDPDDSFCIYCQKQFASVVRLNNHIKSKHHGTVAYWSLMNAYEADAQRQAKLEEEAMYSDINETF
jgi:hypothetical protein